ncbi:hypothetical protein GCM10028807_62680 [Spirosoma daeguense]
MDFLHYVGIDIAKTTLDWAVYSQQGSLLDMHTPNTMAGIKTALRQLKVLPGWDMTQVVFCMEHTGIYNAHVLEFLYKLRLPIWLESSLQIKQAGGMQRGKNDTVDAHRIAQYAYRFRDQIRLWQPPRPVIQQLAFLSAARQRLIQAYNLLAGPLAEQDSFINPLLQKQLQRSSRKSLITLKDEQKAIEQQINRLIEADCHLKEPLGLLRL